MVRIFIHHIIRLRMFCMSYYNGLLMSYGDVPTSGDPQIIQAWFILVFTWWLGDPAFLAKPIFHHLLLRINYWLAIHNHPIPPFPTFSTSEKFHISYFIIDPILLYNDHYILLVAIFIPHGSLDLVSQYIYILLTSN